MSVAHAATSPMQTCRMVSTGLQAVPTLQDAAPSAATSFGRFPQVRSQIQQVTEAVGDTRSDDKVVASKMLEGMAKLRDSADTAGGRILLKLAKFARCRIGRI